MKLRLIVLGFMFLFFPAFSSAQSLPSNELIKNARQYDGKLVVYAGEVIGDAMLRGAYAWVNLNDGDNAVGVFMDASLAQAITYSGNYKARGDVLEVSGVFHRACPEHGGDLDIHAQAVRKIRDGRAVAQRINPDKKNIALIVFGALVILWILKLLSRK